MAFPNYFADAEASFDDAEYVIFGVPYDKTSSFRYGADKAPKEIRIASWNFETYNIKTGVDIKDIKIHDYGDLPVQNDSPKDMIEKVFKISSKIFSKNKFPIAIGGEHSITPGIVKALPKDVAVLSLDAHLDFRQEYENEINNHACAIRRIADHISIENIAVLGIRSAEKDELYQAKENNLFFIDAFEIYEKGFDLALDKLIKFFENKKIYLTLDMDVIDPAFAPATSTPEPFGLTPFDILKCIKLFSSQFIGFDIVEVCPPYDNGETSILAARLIREIIDYTFKQIKVL